MDDAPDFDPGEAPDVTDATEAPPELPAVDEAPDLLAGSAESGTELEPPSYSPRAELEAVARGEPLSDTHLAATSGRPQRDPATVHGSIGERGADRVEAVRGPDIQPTTIQLPESDSNQPPVPEGTLKPPEGKVKPPEGWSPGGTERRG